jgi:hypothetical protein
MFTAHKSVHPTRSFTSPARRRKGKLRYSSITFSDSTGPVLTIYGIGSLTRGGGNGYVASFWKQTNDRYAVRVFDPSETNLATYIGSASSGGAGDTISKVHAAISGSPYIRSVFHKETTEAISASLAFADGTAFSNGRG